MQNKISLLLFLLISTNEIVFGKHKNKSNSLNLGQKSNENKNKSHARMKRSLNDVYEKMVSNIQNINNPLSPDSDLDKRKFYSEPNNDNELPFWGNRGRRDSSENLDNIQTPASSKYIGSIRGFKPITHFENSQGKGDIDSPFWGNRGRRDSGETEENDNSDDALRKYRTGKQEDEPFWGTRGRRENNPVQAYSSRDNYLIKSEDDEPFWGNRGRREESEPFWGNRGRRDMIDPFWGNRGRRDMIDPFWGNRGRRDMIDPFWSNRAMKEKHIRYLINEDPGTFWENRGRRKMSLKESITEAINDVKENIDELAKQSQNGILKSFWANRGRDNQIEPARKRPLTDVQILNKNRNAEMVPSQQNTVNNDEIFAEQPHYILIERSGRSSSEIDPFFISRGKKYTEYGGANAGRDRRGALEEIVKSVRNDPYYIARGKKSLNFIRMANSSLLQEDVSKAKELICAVIDLIQWHRDNKVKREDVNERDRRAILKKLALQLQMDPYFVSRGKKTVKEKNNTKGSLKLFVDHVKEMCM